MGERDRSRDPAAGLPARQHWGGFLIAGAIAFSVDALVLEAGVRLLNLSPLVARIAAIAIAMIAAWQAHRQLTFALDAPPTFVEFFRFAAGAWTTAAVNYAVFALLLLATPIASPLVALFLASCVATIFSYLIMRYGVFWRRDSSL